MKKVLNFLPLVLILIIFLAFYAFGFDQYFTFSYLQKTYVHLQKEVRDHYFLFLIVFGLSYIVVAATSLPIAAFLTILGGFLFGPFISLVVVDIAATLGATLLFLIVKSSLGDVLQKKATPWLDQMRKGFQDNAFSYLLFLRFVPLFPFWAVTIAAALLSGRLQTFFFATLIGIIPGTFVYSLVGNGLGALLGEGREPNLSIIFNPEIFLPLCGLALLSLLPIFYKKRKRLK